MRHFLIQVIRPDDESVDLQLVPLTEVPPEDHAAYRAAAARIQTFLHTNLLALVLNNLKFQRTVDESLKDELRNGGPAAVSKRYVALQRLALQSVLNFASGLHRYQEHMENHAKRHGGEAQERQVHQIFAEHFDASPDLYVMHRLRNLMVHSTLNVVGIAMGTRLLGENRGDPVEEWADIRFNLPKFIDHDRLNERARKHLRSLAPPSVMPVMEKAANEIRAIDGRVLPWSHPSLLADSAEVMKVHNGLMTSLGTDDGCAFMDYNDDGSPRVPTQLLSLERGPVHDFAESLLRATKAPRSDRQ